MEKSKSELSDMVVKALLACVLTDDLTPEQRERAKQIQEEIAQYRYGLIDISTDVMEQYLSELKQFLKVYNGEEKQEQKSN